MKKEGYVLITTNKKTSVKLITSLIMNNSDKIIKELKRQKNIKKVTLSNQDIIKINGEDYILEVKKNKNSIILNDKRVILSCIDPSDFNLKEKLINALYKELTLISVKKLYKKYYDHFSKYLDISSVLFRVRKMSSRWGSCNAHKKSITFNSELSKFDKRYLEYVFIHEMCHLKYQNHSKDFYDFMSVFLPNHKEIKLKFNKEYRKYM